MNCPYCDHQDHLEINLHSDGFSADLIECSECGALLTIKNKKLETVNTPSKLLGVTMTESFHLQHQSKG